jgi:hypothetical protein
MRDKLEQVIMVIGLFLLGYLCMNVVFHLAEKLL